MNYQCASGNAEGRIGPVMDVDYPTPVNFSKSGAVFAMENQSSSGNPIRALNQDINQRIDGIATKVEVALTLSLL